MFTAYLRRNYCLSYDVRSIFFKQQALFFMTESERTYILMPKYIKSLKFHVFEKKTFSLPGATGPWKLILVTVHDNIKHGVPGYLRQYIQGNIS